ncbi:MAG: hypothetical protein CMJ54_10505 [Planctomycetaceae bacterium]|nr:hypothetical protein [Planctomycetaceae bacterium]
MTKRAKKRLLFLVVTVAIVVLVAVVARSMQQSARDADAARRLTSGVEALDRGDYETALSDLSLALIRYPDDVDALLGFAEARRHVPDENGRHLARSLATYSRALELIRSGEFPRATLIRGLEGRARVERMLGQLARLELTSLELIAVDPRNKQAIENMLAVSISLGRLLPGDAGLLVRGQQTNEQWVQRMRDVDNGSALRWAIELAAAEGLTVDLILAIASILNSEDASEIQQMQWGEVRESCTDLLDRWAAEEPQIRKAAGIVAAREALADGRPDDCRRRISEIEFSESDDPAIILLAISIYEALATNSDRETANQLLAQLREMKSLDTETQMMLATRYWMLDRREECLGILEAGRLLESESAKIKVDATLLWMIVSPEERAERIESLRAIAENPELDVLARRRSTAIIEVSDQLDEGGLTSIEFEQEIASLSKWIGDSLLLCAVGDLARAGGLDSTAVKYYKAASDSFMGYSAPLALRLISALAADGDRVAAFDAARRFAGRVNSLQSAVVLLRAWIAIEESGRSAFEIDGRLGAAGDPLDLLETIELEFERAEVSTDSLFPLRCRALLLRGQREQVESEINVAIGGNPPDTTLIPLLRIAMTNQLEIDETLIDFLLESDSGPDLRTSLVDYKSAKLLEEEGLESAVRFLGVQAESDAGEFAIKKQNLLIFLDAEAEGVDRDAALTAVLESEINQFEIQEILNAVIAREDADRAGRIFNYLIDRFGDASSEVASAEGRLTLAFDFDNEASLLKAIARIDKLVAAGIANAKLELILARLWMADPIRNPAQAIDTLATSTGRQPDAIPNLLLLSKLLQDAGRPGEAEASILRLKRLKNAFTPSQLAFFANILGIQGDVEAMRESVCSLAAKSGRTEDAIGCIRLCLQIGDTATADRMLDELAARPTRSLVVDEALAARFVRRGQVAKAIEYLSASASFESEADRQVAIATVQMNDGEWSAAIQSLESIGPDLGDSAEAQLLVAICNLKGPERNTVAARESLDRVLELKSDQAGFLRRAATIALEDVGLVEESDRYIAALREVNREQAELMQIRIDLGRSTGSLSAILPLMARAKAVRDSLVRAKVAWNLYLDTLSRGFTAARVEGDLLEARRLADLVDDAATEYQRQFPGDYGIMSRAGRVKLMIGEPEAANLIARAAMEEIRGDPRLIDNILIAESQYRMKNYLMCRRILEPFATVVTNSPASWPRCWLMLFRSRLYTGDVDGALQLYRARFVSQSLDLNWTGWFESLALASPEIVIAGIGGVPGVGDVPRLQIQSINTLSRVLLRTGDPVILSELRRRLEKTDGSSADPLSRFLFGVSRVEVEACMDVHRGREAVAEWAESLPEDLLPSISKLSQLSPERRAEIDPYVFPVVITLNNVLARSGEDAGSWQDGSERGRRVGEFLRRADEVLEEISEQNAEILDSRALYYLAVGDDSKALALSKAAAKMAPGATQILLTLARSHLASGQRLKAIEVGERASGLQQLSETPDADLKRQIDEFLEVANNTKATVEISLGGSR